MYITICIYITVYIYINVSIYICIYVYICVCIYIYIYMYVCMYVYQVGSKEDNTKTCVTSKIALVLDNKRRQHSNISLKH